MPEHAANAILSGALSPPTELNNLARIVVQLIETMHPSRFDQARNSNEHHRDPVNSHFVAASAAESDAIVAIAGQRGSGKTTLLAASCMQLLTSTNHIVLPIARPETLRISDSILSSFVASLREIVEFAIHGNKVNHPDSDVQIGVILQQASKSAALSGPRSLDIIGRRTESLAQYAMDTIGLINYNDDLIPSMRRAVQLTRRVLGRPNTALFVVPLDDIDLVPHRTMEILSDLRILSCLPGVVPLVCQDPEALHDHLRADIRNQYGPNLAEDHVIKLSDQQIIKTIRPPNSVSPPLIRYERRLDFRPLGENRSLSELVSDVLSHLDHEGSRAAAIRKWLGIEESSDGNQSPRLRYTSWLPSTPRELENLWQTSSNLLQSIDDQQIWSIGPWLIRWLYDILKLPGMIQVDIDQVAVTDSGQISITADVRTISFELSVSPQGGWQTFVNNPSLSIKLRQFSRVLLSREDENPANEASLVDLGATKTEAYLLTQDILSLSAFDSPRPVLVGSIGPTDTAYLQVVRIVGQSTDDRFFSLPVSKGGVLTQRARSVWSSLVTTLYASFVDDEIKLSTFVKQYIKVIVRCWLGDEAPEDVLSSSTADTLPELIDMAGRAYLREEKQYAGVISRDYHAGNGYCYWFEVSLPAVFHDSFIARNELSDTISVWQRYMSLSHRGSEGRDELTDLLRQRIEKNITPPSRIGNDGMWLCGYERLLAAVAPHLLKQIEPFSDEYQRVRDRDHLGRAPTSEAVRITIDQDSYEYADTVTSLSIQERDLLASVLRQLR